MLSLDSKIRFAGVINERGKIISGGLREGLKSLENQKDDEMLFTEVALRTRMRKEFDNQLGKVKFAMSFRDKVIIMSFPIGEHDILYVSANTDLDHGKISMKILEILC